MSELRVLGLCGSLRRHSYNHMALRAAAELMPANMVLADVSIAQIPLYCQDLEETGFPDAVLRLQEHMLAADAILIASPEYNYSLSGVFKNTIDWLSRLKPVQPWRDKPVALLSATLGPVGGARSQYELRKTLGALEALVLLKPEVFINLAHTKFDAHGRLVDEATRTVLRDQMQAFEGWIQRLKK